GSPLPYLWENYGFFPTKKHWKDKSHYQQIKQDLLKFFALDDTRESIAIPPLGCGLGGLDPVTYIPKLVGDCYFLSTIFHKHVELPDLPQKHRFQRSWQSVTYYQQSFISMLSSLSLHSTGRRFMVHLSVDIEATGPFPSFYSMISLGAVFVDDMSKHFYRPLD